MQQFIGSMPMLGIPRRCPVDDAPHTTCTSPDYDGSLYPAGTVIVVQAVRPLVLDVMDDDRPLPAAAVDAVSAPITTASYRRRPQRKARA